MSSKASRIPGAKDRLRKQQIDIRDLQANNRNRNTPRPVATTASAGSSAAGSTGGGTGNFLATKGGTMIGPLALDPPTDFRLEIDANGAIDIGPQNTSQQYSSNIQLDDIQPNTFVLDTIAGAAFDGQLLVMRTFAPTTPFTIAQATLANGGNIVIPSDEDITLGDLQTIILIFDEALIVQANTGGSWRVVSTSAALGNASLLLTGLSVDTLSVGIVPYDVNFFFGDTTKIIATATTGVYKLSGDTFNLDAILQVEMVDSGGGSELNLNWQTSTSEGGPFTNVPALQAVTGAMEIGKATTTTQPHAAAIVVATSSDVFVRLFTTLLSGTFTRVIALSTSARINTVSGTGGGGGGITIAYNTIQDEGIAQTQRTTMNFIGSAVAAVDNPTESRTDITITAGGTSLPVSDITPIVFGSGDATKQMRFEIDNFTTGNLRVMTLPDASVTLAGLGVTSQTWTGTNIFGGPITVRDADFFIQDGVDITKQLTFDITGATTGQVLTLESNHTANRTLTFPNTTTSLAGLGTLSQTWTGENVFVGITDVRDANFTIQNVVDPTKEAQFEVSNITTATTRTYTFQDASGTIAMLDGLQQDFLVNVSLGNNNLLDVGGIFTKSATPDIGDSGNYFDDLFINQIFMFGDPALGFKIGGSTADGFDFVVPDSSKEVDFFFDGGITPSWIIRDTVIDAQGGRLEDLEEIQFDGLSVITPPSSVRRFGFDGAASQINMPTGGTFNLLFNGTGEWSFSESSIVGKNISLSQSLFFQDNAINPTLLGQMTRNGDDILVFTSNGLKNFKDIATGGGATNEISQGDSKAEIIDTGTGTFRILLNSATVTDYEFSDTAIDMKNNDIINLDDITWSSGSTLTQSNAGIQMSAVSGDFIQLRAATNTRFEVAANHDAVNINAGTGANGILTFATGNGSLANIILRDAGNFDFVVSTSQDMIFKEGATEIGRFDGGLNQWEWNPQTTFKIKIAGTDKISINAGDITVSDQILMGNNDVDFGTTGFIDFHENATSVGSAGFASPLPSLPVGYATVKIQGVFRKIPFYNV